MVPLVGADARVAMHEGLGSELSLRALRSFLCRWAGCTGRRAWLMRPERCLKPRCSVDGSRLWPWNRHMQLEVDRRCALRAVFALEVEAEQSPELAVLLDRLGRVGLVEVPE